MRSSRLRRTRGYFLAMCVVMVVLLTSLSYRVLHSPFTLHQDDHPSQKERGVVVSMVQPSDQRTATEVTTLGTTKVRVMLPNDVMVQAVTRLALRPHGVKVNDSGSSDPAQNQVAESEGTQEDVDVQPKSGDTGSRRGNVTRSNQELSRWNLGFLTWPYWNSSSSSSSFPPPPPPPSSLNSSFFSSLALNASVPQSLRHKLLRELHAPFFFSDARINATLGLASHKHYGDLEQLKVMVKKAALTFARKLSTSFPDGRPVSNATTSDPKSRSRGSVTRLLTKDKTSTPKGKVTSSEPDQYDVSRLDKRVKDMTLGEDEGWVDPDTGEEIPEPSTSRPDVCLNCFRIDFPVRMAPSDLCRDLDPDAEASLLVLIASAPRNALARDVIRATWGAICRDKKSSVRCAFMVGDPSDPEEDVRMRAEHAEHGDLLQHGFHDAYVNLTYKTMTGMQWATRHCPSVDYVMKTDDDMYVNTELLPLMLKAAPRKEFVGGFCWGASPPNRDISSKWYVSRQMYRKQHFPPMCSGTGYVLSIDMVYKVLTASVNVPWFHLEDVYMALCVQVYGVLPRNLLGFSNLAATFDACRFRNVVVTSHGLEPHDLGRYWLALRQCPSINVSPSELFVEVPFPQVQSDG